MKKIVFAVSVALALSFEISSQAAKGKEIRDRDIEWSDFTGEADRSSPRYAYTYWMTTYSFPSPSFRGDKVRVKIAVRLFLDPTSWVRPDKRSVRLLNHERGHYRLGRICAKDIEETINSTDFSRDNYRKEIDALYWKIIEKYVVLNKQYDSDTDHYLNVEQQIFWDRRLEFLLNGR
ncbi:MAG: DUF922 domain-containing protein [Pyrinomonadaceae bacterium]